MLKQRRCRSHLSWRSSWRLKMCLMKWKTNKLTHRLAILAQYHGQHHIFNDISFVLMQQLLVLIVWFEQCFYYASAQHSVTGGILFLSCSSMHPCVHPKTLLTRYLAEYLAQFHQWCFLGQRWTCCNLGSEGQGHGGIKYAGNSTFWAC